MMVLDGLHQLASSGDTIAQAMITLSRLMANESTMPKPPVQETDSPAPSEDPPAQFAKPRKVPVTTNYDFLKRGNLNN